jgi:AAA+ superfamily predicted ATPase
MPDDALIDGLEAAVTSDPANASLRRHLVGILVEAGRPERALDHVTELLAIAPDDVVALRAAAACWRTLDDPMKADAYERTANALDLSGPSVPATADELVAAWDTGAPAPVEEPEIGELSRPVLTLDDVGGLADVKARLDLSLFGPLRNPEVAEAFGASVRGGIVLYGPPGCGKTYLARAVAGELGARFYSVEIGDVLDMWLGASEQNVHRIFEVAREHRPCVLFFDEIDALGMRRTQLRHNPSMPTLVNQLLAELDGVSSDNDGLFVLGATNHPWDVDPALLRPGRLGHLVFVPPPDRDARVHILRHHLAGRPQGDLDVRELADRTDGWSGADLRAACEHAVELALDRSVRTGGVVPVGQEMLRLGIEATRPSIGGWVDTARNVTLYANGDGAYDDLAAWLRSRRRR